MDFLHDLITFFSLFNHLQNIETLFNLKKMIVFFIIKTILTIKINMFSLKQSKDMLIRKGGLDH